MNERAAQQKYVEGIVYQGPFTVETTANIGFSVTIASHNSVRFNDACVQVIGNMPQQCVAVKEE